MKFDWQIAVVIACVAWAVSVLVLRSIRLFREPGTSSCGPKGCHDCPSNASRNPNGNDLVQLNVPMGNRLKPRV